MDVSKFAALADGRLLVLERLTLFGRPGQRPAVQGGLRRRSIRNGWILIYSWVGRLGQKSKQTSCWTLLSGDS